MDTLKFKERTKHGRLDFHPKVSYGFEDPDAAPYFKACGWAEDAKGEPDVIVTIDELDIDPCTIWGAGPDRGKFVMPDRAAEARGTSLDEARDYVWNGTDVLHPRQLEES